MTDHLWFNDEALHARYLGRIESGDDWYVSFVGDGERVVPGLVKRVIYAGFVVMMPNNELVTVNPDKCHVVDINHEEYLRQSESWFETQREVDAANTARLLEAQAAAVALQRLQSACEHEAYYSSVVVRVAGCDIEDTTCENCKKILRRSWSTVYDTDPKDQVSDWEWWEREYRRLYHPQVPHPDQYNIVDNIEKM